MSRIGSYDDSPYKIEMVGSEITIKFIRNGDGTGTLNWTLPSAAMCQRAGGPYDGIVIVVDNNPIGPNQTPKDGKYYEADTTVSASLHAGDKIDTARVVGAFYHDQTTNTLTVTDIDDRGIYYFAAFAVDGVVQYHQEGVHTYSQKYDVEGKGGSAAFQVIKVGASSTTATELVTDTVLNFKVDGNAYSITVPTNSTWGDVVELLNGAAKSANNTFVSQLPPYEGNLFLRGSDLYQIQNSKAVKVPASLSRGVAPHTPQDGSFWLDNNVLKVWHNAWTEVADYAITSVTTPSKMMGCELYLFDGEYVNRWDGNVWIDLPTQTTTFDTSIKCGQFWLNPTTGELTRYTGACAGDWVSVIPIESTMPPNEVVSGTLWVQESKNKLFKRVSDGWVNQTVIFSPDTPTTPVPYWVDTEHGVVNVYDDGVWVAQSNAIFWSINPMLIDAGQTWWDPSSDTLYVWDEAAYHWLEIDDLYVGESDPSQQYAPKLNDARVLDGKTIEVFDGSDWVPVANWVIYISDSLYDPKQPPRHLVAPNGVYLWDVSVWNRIQNNVPTVNPNLATVGEYWIDDSIPNVFQWSGSAWVPVAFSNTAISVTSGTRWWNGSRLQVWDGVRWNDGVVPFQAAFDAQGNVVVTSTTIGTSGSVLLDGASVFFTNVQPKAQLLAAVRGVDPVGSTPMYTQMGVGTDGTSEERREMIDAILLSLGYPTISVELTKQQLDFCVDQAIQNIRRYSSASYTRGFIMMNLQLGKQKYVLSDRSNDMHRIVNIMSIRRSASAFGAQNAGSEVYGQMMIQNLYSTTGFDMLTYHLMYEYSELLERLFATRMNFQWNERTRTLHLFQSGRDNELVMLETMLERTEQDILQDRYLNNWCQSWAIGEACSMLAEIRGKYSNLPSASGGLSLNASDLRARADALFAQCMEEIDNGMANDFENYPASGILFG